VNRLLCPPDHQGDVETVMVVRRILKYPTEEVKLRRKSQEIKRLDADTRRLIGDLKDTLAIQAGAGLAAVQIGLLKRVALVRTKARWKRRWRSSTRSLWNVARWQRASMAA
jgi:peptide deformylase